MCNRFKHINFKSLIMSSENTTKNHSGVWYLAPIFLRILGNIVMYLVIKDDGPKITKKD